MRLYNVTRSLVNQTVFVNAHARAKGGGEEGSRPLTSKYKLATKSETEQTLGLKLKLEERLVHCRPGAPHTKE